MVHPGISSLLYGWRFQNIRDRGKRSSIKVDNRELVYWSFRLSSRMEGDGVKGYRYFSLLWFKFNRDHENLVGVRNNISLI